MKYPIETSDLFESKSIRNLQGLKYKQVSRLKHYKYLSWAGIEPTTTNVTATYYATNAKSCCYSNEINF